MATTSRRPVIAGNWKMNLGGRQGADHVRHLIRQVAAGPARCPQLLVLPPFTALPMFQELVSSVENNVEYGAQDVSPYDSGAYTGDISAPMLVEMGCRYVLVGHSERRDGHGEDDRTVNVKIKAALRHGLVPILCVGEGSEVRQQGRHIDHIVAQVDAALVGLGQEDVADLLIAYEPVWAIGTGQVASPEDAQDACAAIRALIAARYGSLAAGRIRILYGGSVKASTTPTIIEQPDIDGALVGGASLDSVELSAIWQSAHGALPTA